MKATLGALSTFLLLAAVACVVSTPARSSLGGEPDVEGVASPSSTTTAVPPAPSVGGVPSSSSGTDQEAYSTRPSPNEAIQAGQKSETPVATGSGNPPGNEAKTVEVGRQPASEADAALLAARDLFSQGMWKEAAEGFSEVLALDSDSSESYLLRGSSFFYLDEVDRALSDFALTLDLDPNNAEAYYFRGRSYRVLGDYEAALNDLDQAIALNPGHGDAPLGVSIRVDSTKSSM